jgi:hypothetical protein
MFPIVDLPLSDKPKNNEKALFPSEKRTFQILILKNFKEEE